MMLNWKLSIACYALKAISGLFQVWPEHGANTMSVGDLLLGFFEYFAAFSFETEVCPVLTTKELQTYMYDITDCQRTLSGCYGEGYHL